MKRPWFRKTLLLSLLIIPCGFAIAAGKKPITSKTIYVSPVDVVSPVSTQNCLRICVAGFDDGTMVTIAVPWAGTPDNYSVLSFNDTADASGGFCIDSPPDWTRLSLQPGSYTIRTRWHRYGGGGDSKPGPSTSFTVAGS